MVMNPNTTTQDTAWGSKEQIINPIARPSVTQELSENVILTTVDDLTTGHGFRAWPLLFGTACCFIEFAALIAPALTSTDLV